MDRLQNRQAEMSQDAIETFISQRISNFDQQTETYQDNIRQRLQQSFQSLTHHVETFELFDLRGTPSYVLVDKQGLLRYCEFGSDPDLEERVLALLHE